ncbi:ABC transporter permease [Bacillus chungangensis]|uniref:ABC transporter permease n=1 Tax=Bacillus chungangensis TaxID=587633 RepID=A0ABT9WVM9_9BACI|nr:ABC transporter permease [Bacillus chungangensis]MDQ0177226.1 hypothetical protein [Bacillus chungangensis]
MKLWKTVSLEFFKLRRKWIFVMVTLFLSVEILWTFMSLHISMSRNPDQAGWEAILSTIASMNGLFLPIIAAIVVSRICDMEHKGDTWKLLITSSVKIKDLYASKYISACIVMFYVIILQLISIVGFGIFNKFTGAVPHLLLLQFSVGTMLANMAVLALQQWLSLAIKNQAFALCLGMVGGFIGMTAPFFPTVASSLFTWSYYSILSPVTSHFTDYSMEFVTQQLSLGKAAAIFLMGMIFYIAGSLHVSRQEI